MRWDNRFLCAKLKMTGKPSRIISRDLRVTLIGSFLLSLCMSSVDQHVWPIRPLVLSYLFRVVCNRLLWRPWEAERYHIHIRQNKKPPMQNGGLNVACRRRFELRIPHSSRLEPPQNSIQMLKDSFNTRAAGIVACVHASSPRLLS